MHVYNIYIEYIQEDVISRVILSSEVEIDRKRNKKIIGKRIFTERNTTLCRIQTSTRKRFYYYGYHCRNNILDICMV